MTRHSCALALIVGLMPLLLAGCGDDDSEARELLSRVQSQGYRNWNHAPGWEARRDSSAHSQAADIFINEIVAQSLDSDPLHVNLPSGSLIVKDGYNDEQLALIAIMEKRSDGWYWAEYSASGEPSLYGHPNACTSCHKLGTDFVRAF